MRRNTVNFLVDLASALIIFGLIATGLLSRFVLPPGSGSRRLLCLTAGQVEPYGRRPSGPTCAMHGGAALWRP